MNARAAFGGVPCLPADRVCVSVVVRPGFGLQVSGVRCQVSDVRFLRPRNQGSVSDYGSFGETASLASVVQEIAGKTCHMFLYGM